ncbi:MAG: hypothetical protein WCT49_00250 [Candidatus Paceibacterota bacterium]|nr:hypothetical protein [Candidatus Paceibacterota bacterium]
MTNPFTSTSNSDSQVIRPAAANPLISIDNMREDNLLAGNEHPLLPETPKPNEFIKNLSDGKVSIISDMQEVPGEARPRKKTLPDHVKAHFEENANAFVSYALKVESDESKTKINEEQENEMWTRAIFFGEFPDGRTPLEIKDTELTIPKKQESAAEAVLPTRINDEISSEQKQETKSAIPEHPISAIPEKPHEETETLPVPKKPEPTTTPIFPRQIPSEPAEHISIPPPEEPKDISPSLFIPVPKKPDHQNNADISTQTIPDTPKVLAAEIPKPPVQDPTLIKPERIRLPRYESKNKKTETPVPVDPIPDEPIRSPFPHPVAPLKENEMGDILKSKIIEGQMHEVFENASNRTKMTLEKMPAKTLLLSVVSINDPDKLWKDRLQAYIIKLKWQAKTALGSSSVTDPEDYESVLDYIKRIYPAIIRAGVNENTKQP